MCISWVAEPRLRKNEVDGSNIRGFGARVYMHTDLV